MVRPLFKQAIENGMPIGTDDVGAGWRAPFCVYAPLSPRPGCRSARLVRPDGRSKADGCRLAANCSDFRCRFLRGHMDLLPLRGDPYRPLVNQPLTMIDKYGKLVFPGDPAFVGPHAAGLSPLQTFQSAFALHQQGLNDQAGPLFRRVLRQDCNHFHCLHSLGLILLQRGRMTRRSR